MLNCLSNTSPIHWGISLLCLNSKGFCFWILIDLLSLYEMVKKLVIRFAFLISVCFLLMHNLSPHLHHSEMTEEEHRLQHEEASSWLDWLLLSFHDDLGGGHLECFSHVEKLQISPKWSCAIPADLWIEAPVFSLLFSEPVNDTVRKNPFILLLARDQILHESQLSNRPPPVV